MMNRSKLVAAWLATLAIAPVIAAGSPACCLKTPVASAAAHGCCPAMKQAQASAPKGCCKAPAAPKPESKMTASGPVAVTTPSLPFAAPASAPSVLPPAVAIRLARRAHHAESADDSPPDRLSRLHILLI